MPELTIYDDIGADFFGEGITAKSIHNQLMEMDGALTVRINSFGGDVFEGQAIYNLISNYDDHVTVVIDGIAASAASIIAMAGDDIEMPINAMMMIHDPWTFTIGNSSDMLKSAEILEGIKDTIVNVYHEKTGLDKEQISQMMVDETWLDADQASEFGFAVKSEKKTKVLNKINKKQWINKIPESLIVEEEIEEKEYPNNAARLRYLEIEAEAS